MTRTENLWGDARGRVTGRLKAGAWLRWLVLASIACVLWVGVRAAEAQTSPAPAPTGSVAAATAPAEPQTVPLSKLFREAFDLFMVLLIIGSLAGWTIIIICFIEVRQRVIAPREAEDIIGSQIKAGRWAELRQFVNEDDAVVSRVVRAALLYPTDDKGGMREAAEMAASEEVSRWFRKIEPLNVIGNLGPLLGLAGTVWGMILAFLALGEAGGQANPTNLSVGISKALMHTLLGLMLAVPCLTVFGFYRSRVDRLCTRAMVAASELVEQLPEEARVRLGGSTPAPARANPAPASSSVAPTPRPAVAPRGN